MKHPAAEFLETPRIRAQGGNKARPPRNGAGCPMEWPHRVQTSGTQPLRTSSGLEPRWQVLRLVPERIPRPSRIQSQTWLGPEGAVHAWMNPTWLGSLCVWTNLRESRETSQGVLENVSRSLGNITLLLILSQDVRSRPDNVPRTGAAVWAIPRVRLQRDIARRADATSIPPLHSTCVYPAKDLPRPSSLCRGCGPGSSLRGTRPVSR